MDKSGWDSGLAEFVYEEISERLTISKAEWLEAAKHWEMRPVEVNGELAAVVMVQGNEVHVAANSKFRGKWLSRKVIRNILGGLIEEYGQVITCVNWGNKDAAAFVERLGFVPDNVVYRLDKPKHIKEKTCRQQQ